MTEPDLRLSPELAAFEGRGGLLDVQVTNLHLDIGRRVTHARPTVLMQCVVRTVTTVQRIYNGELAYRAQTGPEDFGCPLLPSEALFLEDDEPLWVLDYRDGPHDVTTTPDGLRLRRRHTLTVPDCQLAASRRIIARLGYTLLSCTAEV